MGPRIGSLQHIREDVDFDGLRIPRGCPVYVLDADVRQNFQGGYGVRIRVKGKTEPYPHWITACWLSGFEDYQHVL